MTDLKEKRPFDVNHYVSEFEWQQTVADRIRKYGQQLIDDAANIATGALNVIDLDIEINVFADGCLGGAPTIRFSKEYIPQRWFEYLEKEDEE